MGNLIHTGNVGWWPTAEQSLNVIRNMDLYHTAITMIQKHDSVYQPPQASGVQWIDAFMGKWKTNRKAASGFASHGEFDIGLESLSQLTKEVNIHTNLLKDVRTKIYMYAVKYGILADRFMDKEDLYTIPPTFNFGQQPPAYLREPIYSTFEHTRFYHPSTTFADLPEAMPKSEVLQYHTYKTEMYSQIKQLNSYRAMWIDIADRVILYATTPPPSLLTKQNVKYITSIYPMDSGLTYANYHWVKLRNTLRRIGYERLGDHPELMVDLLLATDKYVDTVYNTWRRDTTPTDFKAIEYRRELVRLSQMTREEQARESRRIRIRERGDDSDEDMDDV